MGHGVEEAEPDYDVGLLDETFMTFFAAAIARDIEDRAAAPVARVLGAETSVGRARSGPRPGGTSMGRAGKGQN